MKVQEYYTYLSGLKLADQTDLNDENGLEVDILIGGDQMYKFFYRQRSMGGERKTGTDCLRNRPRICA